MLVQQRLATSAVGSKKTFAVSRTEVNSAGQSRRSILVVQQQYLDQVKLKGVNRTILVFNRSECVKSIRYFDGKSPTERAAFM